MCNRVYTLKQECAKLLWKFMSQAMESDRVDVDKQLREMFKLNLSFNDCHAFANKAPLNPISSASPPRRPRDGSSGKRKERLQEVERGCTLETVAGTRGRSSVAEDRRNIKMVSVCVSSIGCRAVCAHHALVDGGPCSYC